MARKLTQTEIEDNIKNRIKELDDLELVSISYKDSIVKPTNTIVNLRCTKHNEEFSMTYSAFMRSCSGCKKCQGEIISAARKSDQESEIKRLKEHLKKANNLGADLEFISIVGEWKGTAKTKVLIRCNKHNTITETMLQSIITRDVWHCPECVKEAIGNSNRYTPKEAREAAEKKFPDSPLDFSKIEETYEDNSSEVTIHCEKHGDFKKKYSVLMDSDNPQCPDCLHESISYSKDQALGIVKEKIKLKNDNGADLEFLGFVNDTWEGNMTKLILRCNKHNHTWTTTSFNSFCKESIIGCVKCKGEKTIETHKYTPEQAYELAKEAQSKRTDGRVYDLEKIKDTYTGAHERVTIHCEKHGDFEAVFTTLLLGKGMCPDCYKELNATLKLGDENVYLERINNKIQNLQSRGHDIRFLGYVETDTTKLTKRHLKLYCAEHDKHWETTTYDNFVGSNGVFCPICVSTRMSCISEMETFCINETHKHVPWSDIDTQFEISLDEETKALINREKKIRVDIYISSLNAIIEYNGEQHYRYVEYFHKGKYGRFIDQVNRDAFLRRYCEDNGIKLLIIPYKDDKRIPEIIEKFIKEGIDITTKDIETKPLPPAIIREEETCKSLVKYGEI